VLLVAGCATQPAGDAGDHWHPVPLPGKTPTLYAAEHKDGRPSTAAISDKSASMWRRRVHLPAPAVGEVRFSWWVQDLIVSANVAEASKADAPARVMFAFEGDTSSLPARTRALFDLAEALTGERPPYATLVYVWDAKAPVGSVIVNPRTDRIRKIVVESGAGNLGRWLSYERDVAADYQRAFGKAPGRLIGIAVMTDSDNTASTTEAHYGELSLLSAQGRPL
jgi:hypothetical protein